MRLRNGTRREAAAARRCLLRRARVGLVCLALIVLPPVSTIAQQRRPIDRGGFVKSMGQPDNLKLYAVASVGGHFEGDRETTGYGTLGVFRDLLHPAWSLIGLAAEGYVGVRKDVADAGGRALVLSPYFHFAAGLDYNLLDERGDAFFSLLHPVRRGGIVGRGSSLRVDWLPTRGNSFSVGLSFPLGRPYAGKTRPRRDCISFPAPQSVLVPYDDPDPALADALRNVRASAYWINRLTTPYLDHNARTHDQAMKKVVDAIAALKIHMASTGPLFPEGRTIDAEVRVYHAELERAFSIAAEGTQLLPGRSTELGRTVAARAKKILLDEVILPYDRLLGRRKKDDSVLYFGVFARGAFARWLATDSEVPKGRFVQVQYVFQELTDFVEENRRLSEKEWQDSRLTWIPFQYALLPEEHDSQEELDALVERAVDEKFTDGNLVWYVINESFQWEVGRMVREARDYHVLWVHDFRGVNGSGEPDRITCRQVVDSYLAALTQRVREYDETGKIPVYLIIQDQFYYENNKSRDWLALLEDPLHYELDLPRGFEDMEASVAAAQDDLRRAVRASDLLQTEAREYGKEWLANRIKVHVNITNPSDPTFRSAQVIPLFGILDNVIRDHRKISFYDISEEDPYRGMAIFSGMGIGEHYVGPTWEDRGILAQGPAVLSLKKACRQLLLDQGFEEDEIPHPLRPKPMPPDYSREVNERRARQDMARAMQVHNGTGYRPKPISVYKAMMYTLMPEGSVMITPDFVWHSPYWASMLVGSALRGCRAFVILPSLPNQPSPGFPPMARSYEMFARLVTVQNMMADEIAAAGGALKTGFFDPDMDVKDIRARARHFTGRVEKYEFLRELVNPHPSTLDALREVDEMLEERGFEVTHLVEDAQVRRPQLHLKAQFFASREAWEALLPHPVMGEVVRTYAMERARQISAEYVDPTRLQDALNEVARDTVSEHVDAMPPELADRVIWYLSVGSQNQDYRGMFLDGEVTFLTAGWESVWGLVDFVWMLGMCDWVDDIEGVERHLPRYGEWKRRIGRLATVLM